MKLPNFDKALVPQAKITKYLLSLTHEDGRGKAEFFISFGFSTDAWEILANALQQHVTEHQVAKVEPSSFGTRYVVEGVLSAPDGRTPLIRTIWFIETAEDIPRFVTAYPLRRKNL